MTGRIFTCPVCGVQKEDRTVQGNQIFCSIRCANAARPKPEPCPNNSGVWCAVRKCDCCGWNPDVAAARTKAYAERRKAGSP